LVVGFCAGKFAAVVEAAEIVTVEVAVPEPGVIVSGENEHSSVDGIPLQESVMALLNEPDCGLALMVNIPVCPAGMVMELGVALNVTVEGPAVVEAHAGV
jgi:hypothetical protein